MISSCPEIISHSDVVITLNDNVLGGLLGGDVTQLVRLDRLDVKRNSVITADCDGMSLELLITSMGGKFFKDLTLQDAYNCGFNDLDVFKDKLKEQYKCNKLTPLYWYKFKVI